jgi:hypothetical protein
MSELQECGRCRRPAKLRALYGRNRTTGNAFMVGKLGKKCFYVVAGEISRQGYQPENEDASLVVLRNQP